MGSIAHFRAGDQVWLYPLVDSVLGYSANKHYIGSLGFFNEQAQIEGA